MSLLTYSVLQEVPPKYRRLNNMQGMHLSVKNQDDLCFLYAILALKYPQERNAERPTKYAKYMKEFNITGFEFPLKLEDIVKFEELNPGISVMHGVRPQRG